VVDTDSFVFIDQVALNDPEIRNARLNNISGSFDVLNSRKEALKDILAAKPLQQKDLFRIQRRDAYRAKKRLNKEFSVI